MSPSAQLTLVGSAPSHVKLSRYGKLVHGNGAGAPVSPITSKQNCGMSCSSARAAAAPARAGLSTTGPLADAAPPDAAFFARRYESAASESFWS